MSASGDRAEQVVPASTATMRAVVQDGYGPPESLELRDVPVPVPADHEVLVEVRASSLNAADWHIAMGEPYVARPMLGGLRAPADRIQGRDLAGRVVAVGRDVTALRPGDEVFGRAGSGPHSGGAFAEYCCASAAHLVRKPAAMTFEQAAAVPLAGGTALQAVRDAGEVGPGQRVLVVGGSGGVGTFAVQIAALLGAHVTAVCSTRNVELVRSLGAERTVDYTRGDVTPAGERYDVVLDLVGTRSLSSLRRLVAPEGALVLVGGGAGRWVGAMPLILRLRALAPLVRQRWVFVDEVPRAADLDVLAGWITEGRLTPVIERAVPLSETPAALQSLLHEHARGKVVVVP